MAKKVVKLKRKFLFSGFRMRDAKGRFVSKNKGRIIISKKDNPELYQALTSLSPECQAKLDRYDRAHARAMHSLRTKPILVSAKAPSPC